MAIGGVDVIPIVPFQPFSHSPKAAIVEGTVLFSPTMPTQRFPSFQSILPSSTPFPTLILTPFPFRPFSSSHAASHPLISYTPQYYDIPSYLSHVCTPAGARRPKMPHITCETPRGTCNRRGGCMCVVDSWAFVPSADPNCQRCSRQAPWAVMRRAVFLLRLGCSRFIPQRCGVSLPEEGCIQASSNKVQPLLFVHCFLYLVLHSPVRIRTFQTYLHRYCSIPCATASVVQYVGITALLSYIGRENLHYPQACTGNA